MRLVVDTDVIAAALLGEPTTGAEAAALLASGAELHAPSHWKAELANVVWKATRGGRLDPGVVERLLDVADLLPIVTTDVSEIWRGGLARAVTTGVSAYDALFVELAHTLGACLVSYDRQLHVRFPELVVEPRHVRVVNPSP